MQLKIVVSRLIIESDRIMREGKIDPFVDCIAVLDSWLRARPESFSRLALNLGMKPPSPETYVAVFGAFLEKLRDRVERRHPGFLQQRAQQRMTA